MRPTERRGFSLMELLLALSLIGFVLLGARLLFDQIADGGARIGVAAQRSARDGNRERVLRDLLHAAEPVLDSTQRFRGDERSIEYASWCDTPSGWAERCAVRLAVDSASDSSAVIVEVAGQDPLVLRRFAGAAQIRYFDGAARDSSWVRHWGPSIAVPTALAFVTGADTLIYQVGPSRD